MTRPQRAPGGKWIIYERETGRAVERFPVDAKGMLECGEFVATAPPGVTPPPAETPEQRGVKESPNAVFAKDERDGADAKAQPTTGAEEAAREAFVEGILNTGVKGLPQLLESADDVATLEAALAREERKGAQQAIEARLAELTPEA